MWLSGASKMALLLPAPPATHGLPSSFPPPLLTGSFLGPNLPDHKSPEELVTNSDSKKLPRSESESQHIIESSPTSLAPTH